MKLSVIIPVYNEASTFGQLLERVQAVPIEKEILVVDDGSDQATKDILSQSLTDGVRLFTHEHNKGKGAGICTALEHATGDVIIIQDADLEYFPEDYETLLDTYRNSDTLAVYGVRDLSNRSFLMRYGNHGVTWITNLLFGSNLHDMETCYKMIDRKLMQSLNLRSRRFEIEAEISSKLLLAGVDIIEAPIRYEHRDEGKKLSPMDGLPALATLLKYRLRLPEETELRNIEMGLVGLAIAGAAITIGLLAKLLTTR